jgi:PKD repeat protein
MKLYLQLLLTVLICLYISSCKSDSPSAPSADTTVTADFEYSGDLKTNNTIQFNNLSKNADTYDWDFGDGTSSTLENPGKSYAQPGAYTVKLVAKNSSSGKSSEKSKSMQIAQSQSLPISGFSYSGIQKTTKPIQFTNSSQNADTYYWDFGDGTNSSDVNPSHVYSQIGSYQVTLTASHSSNPTQKDDITKTVSIGWSKIKMTKITITAIPHLTSGYWDNFLENNWPDVYCKVYLGSSTLLTTSTYNNVNSVPRNWTVDKDIQYTDSVTTIQLKSWDKDDGSADDFIGQTGTFTISNDVGQNLDFTAPPSTSGFTVKFSFSYE